MSERINNLLFGSWWGFSYFFLGGLVMFYDGLAKVLSSGKIDGIQYMVLSLLVFQWAVIVFWDITHDRELTKRRTNSIGY